MSQPEQNMKRLVARLARKPEIKRDAYRQKLPSPAQKVLTDFRHTTTETTPAPAKSIGEIIRALP